MSVGSQFHAIDLYPEVIDLTDDGDDGSQDFMDDMDLFEENQPEHEHLNGYFSDGGFVVAPGEGEEEEEEDEEEEEEDEEEEEEEEDEEEGDQPQPQDYVHVDCSICLDPVTESDEGGNMTILACGHTYHDVCMTSWLLAKPDGECPICKGTIEGAQNM